MLVSLMESRQSFGQLLESYGIDPLYASALIMIIIVLSQWELYVQWKTLPVEQKRILRLLLIAASGLIIISIIKIVGLF